MFFNIGGGEVLVIAMVALIAVGPEQLPSLLRRVGRVVAQFRSITSDLRDEFMSGLDEVTDAADPSSWMGSGSEDDPVVPRGYADRNRPDRVSRGLGDADDASDDDPDRWRLDGEASARATRPSINYQAPVAPSAAQAENNGESEPAPEADAEPATDGESDEVDGVDQERS